MSRGSPYLEDFDGLGWLLTRDRESERQVSDRVELTIGGRDWGPFARDLQLDNTQDDGGSTVTFSSRKPLEELIGQDVRIRVDNRPYFSGTLKRPGDDGGSRFTQAAVALGPFAEMASQNFGAQVAYGATYLPQALYDIFDRAYGVRGVGTVLGGSKILIVESTFTEETFLTEGAKQLTEPVNFVLLDERDGDRLALRKPRPGGGGAKRIYTPDSYEEGNFTVDWNIDAPYSKVVVFRRADSETGGYDVREEQPVDQSEFRAPAPPNRIWYVPDWTGDALAAKQEAYEIGRDLQRQGTFSLTLPLDPEVWRWDEISASRDREIRGGLFREHFSLVIGGGLTADLTQAGMTMSLNGDALMGRTEPIEDPKRQADIIRLGSPYLVA